MERFLDANGTKGLDHDIIPPIQEAFAIHQVDIDLENEKLGQLQKELYIYKNKYDDLYESTSVAFVTLTPMGLISRANRTAKEMFSNPGEVITNKGFSRWIHVKDHRLYFRCLRQVIEDGGRHSCEVRLIGKSRSFLYIRIEAAGYFDEKKRVVEWVLTLSEISGQDRSETEMHLNEQDLRTLLNNTVAITGLMTPHGILIEVNRAALLASNLQLEDVRGKPLEECYWWAWSPEVQQRLCEAIELAAAGQGSRYDEVVRIKEGEFRTIDFMVAPIFRPDGNVSFLIPSATDITECKRLEEQLKKDKAELASKLSKNELAYEKHRKLLQKIVDNIPVMVFFYNSEDGLYLNHKALETIGVAHYERRNKDIMGRINMYPRYQKKITEFMMAAPPECKNVRLRLKDGNEIETSWFSMHFSEGYYISLAINDSERRTSERKMKHSLKILERDKKMLGMLYVVHALSEQRFRERLVDVLNKHLLQFLISAKKDAENLSARIETKHKNSVECIMERINKSIRTLSALGTELHPSELKQGRLSSMLEWLAWWMQRNYGLTIKIQKDFDLTIDRKEFAVLLFQSVRELLLNIIKHAGVNSASVKLSRDETNQLLVTVADEGSGFDLGTIWEKAQAATGFGLLGIRERMAFLGGSLSYESLPDHGSSFTLSVPLEITGV